jgi:serralysin
MSGETFAGGSVLSAAKCGCAFCAAGRADVFGGFGAITGASSSGSGAAAAQPYYIAALLPSGEPSWSSSAGESASVTYSFLSSPPSYAGDDDSYGFAAANSNQKAAFRQAFALWAAVADITFTEVTDSFRSQIRIGTNDQGGVSSGWGYYPGTGSGGDVYIANDLASMNNPSVVGAFGFSVIIHELGHAIGLKHPGDYNAGGGGTEGPYLPSAEDTTQYSVMSYNDQASGVYNTTPSIYDIAAVQYLYGANTSYQSGDTTYSFANVTSSFMQTIWDGGGTDTLDLSAQTRAARVNLAAGSFSSIGVDGSNNVAIAYGATIENAAGGSGADVITGNSAANTLRGGAGADTLTGGAGDDVIIGGAGVDIAVFSAAYSSYSITAGANGSFIVRYLSGDGDGSDTVSEIETLRFSDRDVAPGSGTTTGSTAVSSSFTACAYAANNADLYNAFGMNTTALEQHYINFGRAEGRQATGFDPYAYAANNADLFNAFGTDVNALIRHYITSGKSEGRVASGFDPYSYAANNTDLFNAYGTDVSGLIRHYITSGKSEGRTVGSFDAVAYVAMNSDIYAAYGLNLSSLISHYVNNGRAEGRSATGFNVEGYATQNSDLFSAFGSDLNKLVSHFISNGRNEGRNAGVSSSSSGRIEDPLYSTGALAAL